MNLEKIQPGMPLNNVHPEYAALTPDQMRTKGLEALSRYIARGRTQAQNVVGNIMNEVPRDRYVGAQAMKVRNLDGSLKLRIRNEALEIGDHALEQLAGRAGITIPYVRGLARSQEDWSRDLAAHNLNELLKHQPEGAKFLVRDIGGRARAVLSDAYKRIDSRPTVDALLGAAQGAGAVVVDGIYTETRVSLKVVRETPIEVFPGEWMVFGLDYSNSDYGDGATEFSSFVLRLACLNGAVSVRELRKIHIGRRLSDDMELSEKTLKLDAAAQVSLAQDQVKALLSEKATDNLVDQIRRVNAKEIAPAQIEGYLKKRVSKAEAEEVSKKFASADVVDLPPGQTTWRFSNALSWLARETSDGRRKMELERLAGEVLTK